VASIFFRAKNFRPHSIELQLVEVKMFSSRIKSAYLGQPEFLIENLVKASQDAFDSKLNPNGFINLGTSVNALNEQEITDWLSQNSVFKHNNNFQHYQEMRYNFIIAFH
jgi:hypothetical protein